MRCTRFFLPTAKDAPSEAHLTSHKLMVRAGMIRQESAGIYSWLPLGCRVIRKICDVIREDQEAIGFNEMIMPTIQSADIWRESGRYDAYGPEMLRMRDRHDREMLYGPTNEEMITAIARSYLDSYRDLPLKLYHIQWKFRDEIRPRFGVMRGREFLMKDAYAFSIDGEQARHIYDDMFAAYLRSFGKLGLKTIAVRAQTGPIGGDLSHEFHIAAKSGESTLYYEAKYEDLLAQSTPPDSQTLQSLYTAADEMHDPDRCPIPEKDLRQAKGIEVGHIFYFGDKYSAPMNLRVQGAQGKDITPCMGSYGIGISRLPAAIIEAQHDKDGIIWPQKVAPFHVGLINLKPSDSACTTAADDLEARLEKAGFDVLHDDRDVRPGHKFADMDLIGLPWHVILGPQGLAQGSVEIKIRTSGVRHQLSLEDVVTFLEKQV